MQARRGHETNTDVKCRAAQTRKAAGIAARVERAAKCLPQGPREWEAQLSLSVAEEAALSPGLSGIRMP